MRAWYCSIKTEPVFDLRFAPITLLEFSFFLSMLNGYSPQLSIALYCAEIWKLLLARSLLHFSCVCS